MPEPIVYLNGQFVPAATARVPVFDRGFLYGDGLFETIRVTDGKPCRWMRHLARLERGADFLRIRVPMEAGELLARVHELIAINAMPDAIVRLVLSRGSGPRGYSPRDAGAPSLVISTHPRSIHDDTRPPRWALVTSRVRVAPDDPLTRFKTCNRLPYVMARMEAEELGADDALLLNSRGQVIDSSCANLFWSKGGVIHTPTIASGALDGITRAALIETAALVGIQTCECDVLPRQLLQSDGVFLTLSTLGVVEVRSIDGEPVPTDPIIQQLRTALESHPG
jgi:branched-chain amino acid aminotransferase